MAPDEPKPSATLPPPPDLGAAGLALWHELADTFDFEHHNVPILVEACRTKDRLDSLDAAIRVAPLTIRTPQGEKVHPVITEARAQQITLTRLIASLRLPDEEGNTPQRRGGARGSYARNVQAHIAQQRRR